MVGRLPYTVTFLALGLIVGANGCLTESEDSPWDWFALEGKVLFQVEEAIRLPDEPGDPYFRLSMRTEMEYPTICYSIAVRPTITSDRITIQIDGVRRPRDAACGTAIAPASANLNLPDLADGRYELTIEYEEQQDRYLVIVSDEFVTVVSSQETFTEPDHRIAWRVPRNAFAYKCGTLCEDFHLCQDFVDLLASDLSLSELVVPPDVLNPFGGPSNGYYCNGPLRVFRYSDPGAFQRAGELLAAFAQSELSGRQGVGLSLTDWTGAWHLSWLLD
jgi:hypothetical protein